MAGVTAAHRAVLAWLAKNEQLDNDGLRGGTLIDYYVQRHRDADLARYAARGEEPPEWVTQPHHTGGSPKVHSWRRTGGRLLQNMADAGLATRTGISWGTPEYRLTEEGKRIAREAAAGSGA